VDWKTGQGEADPLQLEVYGLACAEIWGKRAEELTLTYFYLARGEAASQAMSDPDEIRAKIAAHLKAIDAGEFDPTPGMWCVHCDFRSFCDAGTTWLASHV
jgi:hypothetical protein